MNNLVSIKEASLWASEFINKKVTESNISYLIQYGRINRYNESGTTKVSIFDIKKYYSSYIGKKELHWKDKLGDDLNWALSFDTYKESETTKHVHRIHPYKGKFIPQLVEYFLDDKTDTFKNQIYFNKGDIILDPFCGSGTTLVQANELGIHAIGVDVSEFNTMISNCKIENYDIELLNKTLFEINTKFNEFENDVDVEGFENELLNELYKFNSEYFPSPKYKRMVNNGSINEKEYGMQKELDFLPVFNSVAKKYNIEVNNQTDDSFINKWYFSTTKKEIYFINDLINHNLDDKIKLILRIILSRTIRSCRATTHSDLATLLEPIYRTYYCTKHKKICKPLFSIKKWWNTYTKDTIERIEEYNGIKTSTFQKCFTGDSRNIDIRKKITDDIPSLLPIYEMNKIKGIFSSPPYVGLIDYHEQHAYAYELFSLERKDNLEIGPLFGGTGFEARKSYVEGVSTVLLNCKKYFCNDYEVFLVANDKHNLYPKIAEKAGMEIIEVFKRPVLNRTEKDKGAYSECIFRMKEKKHVK